MRVVVEPEYSLSQWCKEILSGIRAAAAKKKQTVAFFDNADDITGGNTRESVFVVGSSLRWITETANICQNKNLHPIILANQSVNPVLGIFSCVYCDIRSMIFELTSRLNKIGKKRIAIYGVNSHSLPDLERVDAFMQYCQEFPRGEHTSNNNIFNNDYSLEECFKSFLPFADDYDAVLCTNDFTAISLIRRLQKQNYDLNRLMVVSTAGTRLSRWFHPRFESVHFQYADFGKAGFLIANALMKETDFTAVTVKIRWSTTTGLLSGGEDDLMGVAVPEEAESQMFYTDAEILKMLRAEQTLDVCDKTDFRLLLGIFKGETLEQLGERCFISQTTLKYRINALKNVTKMGSRKELASFLKEYVSPELLEKDLENQMYGE